MYSKRITRKDLSKAWALSTTKIYIKTGFENLRNVFYTHIDEAKDFRGKSFNQIAWGNGIFEAVKYVMKPPSLKTGENYARYFEATQGLRLTRTKGAFYHLKVLKKPEKRKPLCKICGGEMIQEDFGLSFSEAKDILAKNRIKADNLIYYLNNFSPNIVWVKEKGEACY